jgi:predicted O-methyltransferase YrrM
MQPTPLTRRITASPLARAAAFPLRVATVARYNADVLKRSGNWLVRSRENSSFTYELRPANRDHLAWFIAAISETPVDAVRGYMREAEEDDELRRTLQEGLALSFRRRTCDRDVRYGRRVAHYALVRAMRPKHVVEAGPHRGISTCLIAAALLRNERGRVTAIDIDPQSCEVVRGRYATVVDQVTGDSVKELGSPEVHARGIDLLFLDTYVTPEHETAELAAAAPALSERAVILTVGALTKTWPAMARWSEDRQRRFLHFDERPHNHWYPGGGLGASFTAP